MGRDIELELDQLKDQVREIKAILMAAQAQKIDDEPKYAGHIQKMPTMHPDPAIMDILSRLEDVSGEVGESGAVTYVGVFASGGRQSTWIQNEIGTDGLLRLIENRMAEKVLSCIGSNDRLNILLALLRAPMTVAMLVEECGYNSTGQVYHHLKPLIAADLIAEDKNAQRKGTYIVKPNRVQGIIMLLAGIHDLTGVDDAHDNWGAELHEGATMVDERYMVTDAEAQKIIDAFFLSTEPLVLKTFSSKEKKKLVILRTIVGQFDAGKRYSEKEVNAILEAIYPDFATIRRYLIEYGFMDRTPDCGAYWRK